MKSLSPESQKLVLLQASLKAEKPGQCRSEGINLTRLHKHLYELETQVRETYNSKIEMQKKMVEEVELVVPGKRLQKSGGNSRNFYIEWSF